MRQDRANRFANSTGIMVRVDVQFGTVARQRGMLSLLRKATNLKGETLIVRIIASSYDSYIYIRC